MNTIRTLNEEQLQAVKHGDGPLLIIAGAGTGKTTVITQRIKHLILEKKVAPSEILALTFTEKSAAEMEERVDVALPYGYTQLWIETFHAFCDRILRSDAIHIGLNPAYKLATEAESILFLRKHLFQLKLRYFQPLGNPYKFLQGFLTHISRLRDDDITADDYGAFAEKLGRDKAVDADEVRKTLELANAYKIYETLKAKEGIMDFADLISNVLKLFRTRKNILSSYQNKFKYILVDEFQDTNFSQNEMAILLAGARKNITVVGDDDQCLPGDTLITTLQGKKQIKNVKKGEQIVTAVGKGALGISTVNKVFKNKKEATFLKITTKSGVKVTTTDNHKMFCYIPKKVSNKIFYYVYLMHRKNLGWRIGTTNDLAVRLKLERSSDAIIGLRAFITAEEARYHELLWSLKYQIPTCIFKERNGVMLQGKLVERLYEQFNTEENAQRLAKDLGINLTNFHYVLGAVTRGQSKRIKINFYQCYRRRTRKTIYRNNLMKNPLITHGVSLETSNNEVIDQLNKNNIHHTKSKKGIRVRFFSSDINKVSAFAEKLALITGGFIEMQSVIGTLQQVDMPALIMPASNLLEGLYVPVVKNEFVYYDEIVTIERFKKTEIVYDLEIDKTHNFIANDIVVHNSIYRWRGAAISNIIQFRKHFPKAKVIALTKNYRSTQEILDRAYQLIQFNNPDRLEVKEKVDKKLIASRPDSGAPIESHFANRVENEAEFVTKKIKELVKDKGYEYKDFAILVRANDHAQPFVRALERGRIPYQFLGPGRLFHQEEIKDLLAYLKILYNFEDNASVYRMLTMPFLGFDARDIAAILNFAKRKNYLLFEALENIDELTLKEEVKIKIKTLTAMIHRHLKRVPRESAGQILYYFFEESGLFREYLAAEKPEEEKKVQNVARFFEKLKNFEAEHTDASIFAVVDWIDLSMELGESPLASEADWSENNAVNIMTVHSSKGLEFPVVFLVSLLTQRFPSRDRKEQIPVPEALIKEVLPEGDYNLQEERRLFYVGMTRAKDLLFLTASFFVGEGRRERKISPFVYEALGEKAVKKQLEQRKEEMFVHQMSLLDIMQPKEPEIITQPKANTTTALSYISYSQLQTFDMCPLHYKLKYILKMPGQPAPALSFGISLHNVMKDYYQALINKEEVNQVMLETMLQKRWINQGYQSKAHAESAFAHAKEVLTNYVKNNPDTSRLPAALELPFQYNIGDLRILGRIDRIDMTTDGKLEIIDYKTGDNIPDEKKLNNDLQLTMYALAATKMNDAIFRQQTPENVLLSLYYLEKNVRLTTMRTKEQLLEAEELILKKVEEITTSSFECRGGIFCKTCEYKMVCQSFGS